LRRIEANLPDEDVAAPRPEAVTSVSSDEAQALWQRAAQLQDATGAMPPLRMAARPSTPRENPTTGYALDQVRDAAREAGIATQFVDRAIAERGLVHAPQGEIPVKASYARESSPRTTGGSADVPPSRMRR
jgi:hypothetical protein